MNGVVDHSDPLSREVGLEQDDVDENILFTVADLFDGFSYSRSTSITENFNVEGNKHDNDCGLLSNEETRVPESSDSSKGYVENSITDKTVAANSLSTFYINLKVHTLFVF